MRSLSQILAHHSIAMDLRSSQVTGELPIIEAAQVFSLMSKCSFAFRLFKNLFKKTELAREDVVLSYI